jgi:hypothetical protein
VTARWVRGSIPGPPGRFRTLNSLTIRRFQEPLSGTVPYRLTAARSRFTVADTEFLIAGTPVSRAE